MRFLSFKMQQSLPFCNMKPNGGRRFGLAKKRNAESYLNKTKSVSSPLAKQPSRIYTRFNIHTPLFHICGREPSRLWWRRGSCTRAVCGPLLRRLTPARISSSHFPGKNCRRTKSAFSHSGQGFFALRARWLSTTADIHCRLLLCDVEKETRSYNNRRRHLARS